ncbi:MAG: hypothetical protein JSU58_06610 [Dehalococcoidales bacterium]|nr:MAG: hypothetical protein JSU58_06610 [Dehalococcoidales bacterium]
MSKENPIQILTETEEDIARLYEAYASEMPEHEEFWFGLVLEEADHSNLVHRLIKEVHTDSVSFTSDPAIIDKLKEFRNFLVREKEKVKQEDLAFTDALQVAVDIENSIIKSGIYHLFKNPSGDVVDIVEKLRHDNTNHIKFLRIKLEKYRKKR